MDYKKIKAPTTTVTRNITDIAEPTGNVYESVAIIAKRANQISTDMKDKLDQKLQEFAGPADTLDEEFHNDEQITVSRHFEKMPKSTLIATEEFLDGKLNYTNTLKDTEQ